MQNEGPWQVHEGAMRGLRVLDLSRILSGPFASMVSTSCSAFEALRVAAAVLK
jgi:formyl-CoA transferase/CoA:oxalate CoA-transferase